MKRVGTIVVCLAGGLAWGASLRAEDAVLPGNPYAVVVARNIFGLNPPVVVDPNAVVVEPPVKIVPNGIMTIFGQVQVLFKVPATKPGGKDANYILTEGQSQDDIEVTKINEKAGIVTFNNHGIVQELPLVVTAPSSTPSAPTGGRPGVPGLAPGLAPGGANTGNNPFMNRFGNRGGRAGGGINPGGANNSGGGNGAAVPMSGGPSFQGNPGQQMPLTGDAQMAAMIIEKAKAVQENSPAAAIFPPTPLDEQAGLPSNLAPGVGTPPTLRR